MLRKNARNYNDENRDRTRRLRQEKSISEKVLWGQLRRKRLGFKFRSQHPIGPHVLDFYCAEAMLCVEVDGEQHLERVERDAARDAYLARLGIETIRIPSLDLFEETGKAMVVWLEMIQGRCEARSDSSSGTPFPNPFPLRFAQGAGAPGAFLLQ